MEALTATAPTTAGAANDDQFITPVVIATGRQRYSQKQQKNVLQTHYSTADHITCNDIDTLWQALTAHGQKLIGDSEDEAARADLKARLPFYFGGGLVNGGYPSDKSGYDLPYSFTQDAANDCYRRRNVSEIAPCSLVTLDADKMPPALVDVLTKTGGVLESYRAFFHHTASSTAANPRGRIGVILTKAVNVAEKGKFCASLERALMAAAGAEPTDTAGHYVYQGRPVEFDPSVYREAQVCFAPDADPDRGMLFDGQQLDPDTLPPLSEEDAKRYAASSKKAPAGTYSVPDELTGDAALLVEWFISIGGEPGNKPGLYTLSDHPFKSSDTGGVDTSFALQADQNAPLSRFQSARATWAAHMAECTKEHRSGQFAAAVLLGCPRDLAQRIWGEFLPGYESDEQKAALFEIVDQDGNPQERAAGDASQPAPAKMYKGAAVFRGAKPGDKVERFSQWDGMTGDKYADELRQEIADSWGKDPLTGEPVMPLRLIPPMVHPRYKDDRITGFKALNHAQNFRWALYRAGWQLVDNRLTGQTELFRRGDFKRLSEGEAQTESMLTGIIAEYGLPDKILKAHAAAVAGGAYYHPAARLLDGIQWDGVDRVSPLLDCVPVAPDLVEYRNVILGGTLAAIMAAVDDGKVTMKYVPVLHSEKNSWLKTAFWGRLVAFCPDAYREGCNLDPSNKDSMWTALTSLVAELGESDGVGRVHHSLVKQVIGRDEDTLRLPYGRFNVMKPRQTIFVGSTNGEFIPDPSMSTRFPTVALAAPIRLDEINSLLGYQYDSKRGELVRVDAAAHLQFWAQVRAMRAAGQITHMLTAEQLGQIVTRNIEFENKGQFYEELCDVLLVRNEGQPFLKDWFSPTEAADLIRAGSGKARIVGRTLSAMAKAGLLEKKRGEFSTLYRCIKK